MTLTVPADHASPLRWEAFAEDLRQIMINHRDIGHERFYLTEEQASRLNKYQEANILFISCLRLAYVSDRDGIENSLLLPP
jgi:hypothetical protein